MYNNYSVVVSYTYDAWGNPLTTTGTLANTIGAHNPLRYRGYVYDTETGFYYLQSRYYDPTTGRFINADGLVSTGQGLLSNNMFAYCGNNPVIRNDNTGEFFFTILGATIGAITGLLDAAMMGTDLARGALAGAISGGIAGLGVDIGIGITVATGGAGTGVGVAIAGVFGTVGSMVGTGISSNWEAEPIEYFGSVLVGGLTNMISFGLAPGAKDVIATGTKTVVGGIWKDGAKDFVNNVATGTVVAEAAIWIYRVMAG